MKVTAQVIRNFPSMKPFLKYCPDPIWVNGQIKNMDAIHQDCINVATKYIMYVKPADESADEFKKVKKSFCGLASGDDTADVEGKFCDAKDLKCVFNDKVD